MFPVAVHFTPSTSARQITGFRSAQNGLAVSAGAHDATSISRMASHGAVTTSASGFAKFSAAVYGAASARAGQTHVFESHIIGLQFPSVQLMSHMLDA